MEQLTLAIRYDDATSFDSFYVAEINQLCVTSLVEFAQADSLEQCFYLWGEAGVGKTHLAQSVCQLATQSGLRVGFLDFKNLYSYGVEALNNLELYDFFCWENFDAIFSLSAQPLVSHSSHAANQGSDQDWETHLFHAFNRLREQNTKLLITANRAASQLDLRLPDLESRLRWGQTFHLKSLADDEQVNALIFRAGYRGMELSDPVARFILKRVPRRMDYMENLLDKLDKKSLSAQRKVTIPFIKSCFSW